MSYLNTVSLYYLISICLAYYWYKYISNDMYISNDIHPLYILINYGRGAPNWRAPNFKQKKQQKKNNNIFFSGGGNLRCALPKREH